MTGTLFAQEFRTTRKALLTAVGVTLLVAAMSLALAALRVPVLGGVGLVVGIIAVVLVTPLTMGLLVASYWRTMYGREGYFTMTIPVRGRTLFAAKVLYGLTATVAAVVITLGAAAGAVAALALSQGNDVSEAFHGLWDSIHAAGPSVWIIVVAAVLQLVYTVVAGAALMSIGAQGRFNHLGFGAPVIGAVILYVVMQVVGLAAMLFVPLSVRLTGPDAGTLVRHGMYDAFVVALQNPSGSDDLGVLGLGILLVSVAATVVLAWWGARSVERHTSLR